MQAAAASGSPDRSSGLCRGRALAAPLIRPIIDTALGFLGATMTTENISKAMARVRTLLARRPEAGIHPDEPAFASWDEDTRVVVSHPNGTRITTDMPVELGGSGNELSPGWMLRAGLASCLATRIAMQAAATGISLTRLEVRATSTSDARGLLGMMGAGDEPATPAPSAVQLEVTLSAPDVEREQLQAMVELSFRCSPVSAAVETAVPVSLRIDIAPG
jgi:uncharacterized OsmC-like protein